MWWRVSELWGFRLAEGVDNKYVIQAGKAQEKVEFVLLSELRNRALHSNSPPPTLSFS